MSCLGEMPIQSFGQSVSAPRGKAGARLNAHTELRAKCQRSAHESGRLVECPYRFAGKASALGAGCDIPKSAYMKPMLKAPGSRAGYSDTIKYVQVLSLNFNLPP
jgi:hypothetical protein